MPTFAACIITYQPQISRLRENIAAIAPQVDALFVVDNGSDNSAAITELCAEYTVIELLRNDKNLGIAHALNQATQAALQVGYDWLLTLDQDSIVPSTIIADYSPHIHTPKVGMLCCRIIDRNVGDLNKDATTGATQFVAECITSAALLRISAWQEVGGFCTEMFIDGVDFDYCYLLSAAGYDILRINQIELLHEVGRSTTVSCLGKRLYLFHHSPTRCYYMIRNSFYLGQRHHRHLHFALEALKRFVLVAAFETQKTAKITAMIQGAYHALRGRYGQRPT